MALDLTGLLDAAAGAISDTLRITVKTNLGPALTLYNGAEAGGKSGGFSPGALLGLKAAVKVQTLDGRTIYSSGEAPPTEPIKAAIALVLAAGVLFVFVRGLRSLA